MWLSIFNNLVILAFFKYYNFFAHASTDVLELFGMQFQPYILNIVLPVGISFYTFHGMSYVIDIYRGRTIPTTNFVNYASFVCFFPLLVAGPIERATHLLPQINIKREFDYAKAVDGLKQMLWGFYKKVVIADNCAVYVNNIFDHYQTESASTLVLGAVFFSIQIYCDFSGYSDIALGCARLFGFELLRNFSYPYFSRDIAEFWRRWHISLTTWFRDYLYIPLGGSRGSTFVIIRNTFIIFIVSGFWHGANWTFIAWGLLNAIYFLPLLLTRNNRKNLDQIADDKLLPSIKEVLQMAGTFILITIAWIFFRSPTITDAISYISHIFSPSILKSPDLKDIDEVFPLLLILLFAAEWYNRSKPHALQFTGKIMLPKFQIFRWSYYVLLILLIFWLGGGQQTFIYFQF